MYIKSKHHIHKLLITCHSEETLEYIQSKLKTFNIKLNKINNYTEINNIYNITILQINNSFATESILTITEDDLLNIESIAKESIGSMYLIVTLL